MHCLDHICLVKESSLRSETVERCVDRNLFFFHFSILNYFHLPTNSWSRRIWSDTWTIEQWTVRSVSYLTRRRQYVKRVAAHDDVREFYSGYDDWTVAIDNSIAGGPGSLQYRCLVPVRQYSRYSLGVYISTPTHCTKLFYRLARVLWYARGHHRHAFSYRHSYSQTMDLW